MRQRNHGGPPFTAGAVSRLKRASPALAAEQQFRKAVEHMRRREPGAAQRICERLVKFAPQSAPTHFLLGAALDEQHQPQAAIRCYRRVVALDPGHAAAWINLADALRRHGESEAAADAARRAAALSPQSWQSHYNLGRALFDQGEFEAALDPLEKSATLGAPAPEITITIAKAHERLGAVDTAIAIYRQILEAVPQNISARLGLAGCLRETGDQGEARDLVAEAHRIAPDDLEVARSLAEFPDALDAAETARLIERIERALAGPNVVEDDRIKGHFAAGRFHERNRNHGAAFRHYDSGNALQRRRRIFDGAGLQADLERAVRTFTPEFFGKRRDFGLDTRQPIFIFGMPRSGTTLVEQILASHPKVFGAGETKSIWMIRYPGSKDRLTLANVAERVPVLTRDHARRMAESLLGKFSSEAGAFDRMTDKTPANFLVLGVLALLFPRATFLHCERHPLDTCLSCFTQNFLEGNGFSCSFDRLAAYYRLYRQFMAHWREMLPAPIVDVRYEDVIADQERMSRMIVAAAGLDWHDGCLRFFETRRRVATASVMQVRRPVYASSVGKWRDYATELAPLRDRIADLIEAYECQPSAVPASAAGGPAAPLLAEADAYSLGAGSGGPSGAGPRPG